MRLGMRRKIYVFRKRKYTLPVCMACISAGLLYFTVIFFINVQPVFSLKASAYINNAAVTIINNSMLQVFENDKIVYNELMNIKYDDKGNVVSVTADTQEINRLKSKVSTAVQKNVEEYEYSDIKIPFGSVLKNNVFQGVGPNISFSVSPTGMTKVDFNDEFVSGGINQVRHKIYLDVSVTISLVSAAMQKSETVNNRVLVAETVIVGTAPNYYADNTPINAVLADDTH